MANRLNNLNSAHFGTTKSDFSFPQLPRVKPGLLASGLLLAVLAGLGSGCDKTQSGKDKPILVEASRGDFEATLTVTGELQARNSINILGPAGMRQVQIYQTQITDLVEEGTRVREGDWVATLDRSEASNKLGQEQAELTQLQTQYEAAVLDSTLNLRDARDQLINLKYVLEEAKITVEQSQFEPPAIIRQAEIAEEKAERAYTQAVENYSIKQAKESARLQEISGSIGQQRIKIDNLLNILDQFNITAPADGMVTYRRNWNGVRQGIGTQISAWSPVVATLPDLSEMVSVTYVNEVDISRVQKGQPVELGIDAFPDRVYNGTVESVANIGEQRPNSDAKVFEVRVLVHESDTTLRPAMTTSNLLVTADMKDVVSVPTECVHADDSTTFVYLSAGAKTVRKEIITGIFNENNTVVLAGLEAGDKLYLSRPERAADARWEALDPALKAETLAAKKEQAPKPKVEKASAGGDFESQFKELFNQ